MSDLMNRLIEFGFKVLITAFIVGIIAVIFDLKQYLICG